MGVIHDANGNAISRDNPLYTKPVPDAIQPVNMSYRESSTIQTHNAVSVGASSSSTESIWHDALGYDKVAMTMTCDSGSISNYSQVQWSNDGVTVHGSEGFLNTGTGSTRAGITDIKARYFRFMIGQSDTVAHTMSAWAYLKA